MANAIAVEPGFDQGGILLPGQVQAEQTNNIVYYVQQAFTNFFPLMSRVNRIAERFQTFKVRHWKYQPRRYNFTSAMNATDTYSLVTIPPQVQVIGHQIGDDSALMAGDVLEVYGNNESIPERVEVVSTCNVDIAAQPYLPPAAVALLPAGQFRPNPGTILVKRGVDGTAAQSVAAQTPAAGSPPSSLPIFFVLMGNSRTGGEVWQSGIRATPLEVDNQCQTMQTPVQVGGSVESSEILGIPSMFGASKQQALFNHMRKMEAAAWFSNGEPVIPVGAPGYPNRPKMAGIRAQSSTLINANNATTPTAYTPASFRADVLQTLYNFSAPPDVMFCSPAFLGGLDDWGAKQIRIEAGRTELGIVVEAYNSTIAPGVTIIPAPILGGVNGQNLYRAWIGRFENLLYHQKRAEFFQNWGVRGDAIEGEWISEGAIESRDSEKSVWLEGISAMVPQY